MRIKIVITVRFLIPYINVRLKMIKANYYRNINEIRGFINNVPRACLGRE